MVLVSRGLCRLLARAIFWAMNIPQRLITLISLCFCLAACSDRADPPASAETILVREQVAHWFEGDNLDRARVLLAPLVADSEAATEDLVRAAAVEFAASKSAAALAFLERAAARDPKDATVCFLRGQLAREAGQLDLAARELRAALAAAPKDLPTRYLLAVTLGDLDQFEESEALLRQVLAAGLENGGSWYVSALYRLERLLVVDGREDEARAPRAEREALKSRGISAPATTVTRLGTLGRVVPPRPTKSRVKTPPASLAFAAPELILPEFAAATDFGASDIDGDGRHDLWALTGAAVLVAFAREDTWQVTQVAAAGADFVLTLDLDNAPDAELELLCVRDRELSFHKWVQGSWREIAVQTPELDGRVLDVVAVDFDHEGDLDLLVVGEAGVHLWRNDGAGTTEGEERGAFRDASSRAGLPEDGTFDWALVEDLDGDGDVDLLVGSSAGPRLFDSLRGGRFAELTERLAPLGLLGQEPHLFDFDGDGQVDLWPAATEGGAAHTEWFSRTAEGGFTKRALAFPAPAGSVAVDLDLDGAIDLVGPNSALAAAGLEESRMVQLAGLTPAPGAPRAAIDVDGDRKIDLVYLTPEGLVLQRASGPRGHGLKLVLRGNRANRRGQGAKIEVRAGPIYRRVWYRGEPLLLGSGAFDRLDVLRITWPNGILQSDLDLRLSDQTIIDDPEAAFGLYAEPKGLIGSCPFLYTWNGERFEFITDVLGITPLGLPIAPGVLVPPDHDEYVLVRGEQLQQRKGELVLQFTEELREVTYLDRVRLDVIDHPMESEIFPNERFCFPPFPEARTHCFSRPLAPRSALGSDGVDWSAALAHLDDQHAKPFVKHAPQFQGLARPWFLELEFDGEGLAEAEELRLALSGWFFWSDASCNIAAAGQEGVDFVPPIFEVPDGQGGWRAVGPPVGFPAGKTKTMVIDVSDIGLQQDPRLRISCTLQLYWDRIALFVGADLEFSSASLEATAAELYLRGFSAPEESEAEDLPERFDWQHLARSPRWNQHPGRYTRLGPCLELLSAVDDRFVIMGSGDALCVRFDASSLAPVAPGMRRDYLLFLDGWAKDRDLNTVEALEVEPLPFHAMTGYPYGPDESFPGDREHRAWRDEWNTREGIDWIEPLTGAAQR